MALIRSRIAIGPNLPLPCTIRASFCLGRGSLSYYTHFILHISAARATLSIIIQIITLFLSCFLIIVILFLEFVDFILSQYSSVSELYTFYPNLTLFYHQLYTFWKIGLVALVITLVPRGVE